MANSPSLPPPRCAYCSLWKQFVRHGGRHYDDVAHAPWAADGPPPEDALPWQNIIATPPSAQALAEAAAPSPARRCAKVGLKAHKIISHAPALRLQWLHIPKAGSSFGTTLFHFGCPRIPADAHADDGAPIVSLTTRFPRRRRRWCNKDAFSGNLNGHEPLRYPTQRGRTVALFRRPAHRLASECAALESEFTRAFGAAAAAPAGAVPTAAGGRTWANASVYSHSFLREFLYSHGLTHAAIEELRAAWNTHRRIPIGACTALDGLRGCQTKMVLGVPCAAPFALNASLLAEATRRVRDDFLFVGLTERFEASVCLFHARLGGSPVPAQFLNTRPRGVGIAIGSSSDRVALPEAAARDEWDEALYRAARERFETDVRALS